MKRDSSSSRQRAADSSAIPPSSAPASSLPPLCGKLSHLGIAAGVFLIATLVVFGSILFDGGDRILSLGNQDIFNVFVGWYEFTASQMKTGNLPLWNPHLYGGAPCLGGFQEALCYPPTWLHLILPLPQAINWGIALHVFLAGLFTCMWMLRRGLHVLAAIVSGLIFMFGGGYFLHILAGHIPNLQTMVWAPLIFLAIDDLTTTRFLRGAWLGAGAVMMQIFAGHPQYVYYTALIAGPYALLGLWNAPSRRTALIGLVLIAVGGIALSAIQLFTGLQAAHESLRAALTMQVAGTFAFPPENFLTLAVPGFFGSISTQFYWGRWLLWEDSLFVGVVGFVLALYGTFRGERAYHTRTLGAFAFATFLIALGAYTPIYTILFHALPGFSSFRGVSKIAFLAALFTAALAGVGLDRLIRNPSLSKTAPISLGAIALLAALLAIFIWHSGNLGAGGTWGNLIRHIDFTQEAYQHGMLARNPPTGEFFARSAHVAARELGWAAGTCAILAACWFLLRWNRKLVYAIAVLSLIELTLFARQNVPTFDRGLVTYREDRMRAFMQQALPPDARMLSGQPSFVLAADGNDAWGNDPMVLKRYAEFMAINQGVSADEMVRREYPWFSPSTISPTWGMARVWAFFVPGREPGTLVPQRAPGIKLARAQLIENYRIIDDSARLLKSSADRTFDPRKEVLLEKSPADFPPSPATAPVAPGRVEIKDLPGETDEVEITADVQRPCILLITDNYSTGWHTVPLPDAAPRHYEVLPANHTFQAIPLVPGSHHLILEYRPLAYTIGKWLTSISLLIWIAAGVMLTGWIKPKAKPDPETVKVKARGK